MKNIIITTILLATGTAAHATTQLHCLGGPNASVQLNVALSSVDANGNGTAEINGLHGSYTKRDAQPNTRLSSYAFVDVLVQGNNSTLIKLHFISTGFKDESAPTGTDISNEWAEIGRIGESGGVIIDQTVDLKECIQNSDQE